MFSYRPNLFSVNRRVVEGLWIRNLSTFSKVLGNGVNCQGCRIYGAEGAPTKCQKIVMILLKMMMIYKMTILLKKKKKS